MAVIGVDLGGTKVAAALYDQSGKMYSKEIKLLNGAEGDAVGQLVVDVINTLILRSPSISVEAIGVCVPGIVYSKKDTVWAPNIPGSVFDVQLIKEMFSFAGWNFIGVTSGVLRDHGGNILVNLFSGSGIYYC